MSNVKLLIESNVYRCSVWSSVFGLMMHHWVAYQMTNGVGTNSRGLEFQPKDGPAQRAQTVATTGCTHYVMTEYEGKSLKAELEKLGVQVLAYPPYHVESAGYSEEPGSDLNKMREELVEDLRAFLDIPR